MPGPYTLGHIRRASGYALLKGRIGQAAGKERHLLWERAARKRMHEQT